MKKLQFYIQILFALVLICTPSAAVYRIKKFINLGFIGPQLEFLGFSQASNRMFCPIGPYNAMVAVECDGDSTMVTVPGSMMAGPMVFDQARNYLYMKGNDELTVIDCASLTEDTSFMTGQGGLAVEYNPVDQKIYCLDEINYYTRIYSAVDYQNLDSIADYGGPMIYYQVPNRIYIPKLFNDTLGVFAGSDNSLVAKIPIPGLSLGNRRMGLNASMERLYIAVSDSDRVAIVNTADNSLLSTPQVGDNPCAFAFCPQNNKMFVACNGIGPYSLWTIDNLGNVDSMALSDSLSAVIYNPVDSMVYAADWNQGLIYIVDGRGPSPVLVQSIDLQYPLARPASMVVDNDGDVYVAAQGLDVLPVIGRVPSRMWRSDTTFGSWQDASSWEFSDDGGNTWLKGESQMIYPIGPDDSTIVIRSSDTINMYSMLGVDQLIVDGMLNLNSAINIVDGPGWDLDVKGMVRLSMGNINLAPMASMRVDSGGSYIHGVNGGSIPRAEWSPYSTLSITMVVGLAPLNMDQNFGNIIWDCPSQSTDIVLPGGPGFSVNNLEVMNTGSGRLRLTSSAVPELIINGNLNILGNSASVVAAGSGTRKVLIQGHLGMMNSQPLALYDPAAPGICTLRIRGDYSYTIAKAGKGFVGPSGPDSAAVIFCGGGPHHIYSASDSVAGYVDFIVEPPDTIYIEQYFTLGNGSLGRFWLMPGSYLWTNHTQGVWASGDMGCIRNNGPRIFGPGAGFLFGEAGNPILAGDGVSGQISWLRAANSQGVKLSSDVLITEGLVLQGLLDIDQHRMELAGTMTNQGGLLRFRDSAEISILSGPGEVTLPVTSTDTLGGLRIDRLFTTTLQGDLNIRRRLELIYGVLDADLHSLYLGDSIQIVRTVNGFLMNGTPSFGGVANLTYSGGLVSAGPEMPSSPSGLWDLSIPDAGDGLVMSSPLVVNGTLNLGGTLSVDDSDITLNGPINTSGSGWIYNWGMPSTLAIRGNGLGALPNYFGHHLEINRPTMLSAFGDLKCNGSLRFVNGSLSLGAHSLFIGDSLVYSGDPLNTDSLSSIIFGYGSGQVSLPPSVTILDSLVLNNPNGLNLSNDLTIKNRYVQLSGNILSGQLHYRPEAWLDYRLDIPSFTTLAEFPESDGPRKVSVASQASLYLHQSRIIPDTLRLIQGQFDTGFDTLYIAPGGAVERVDGYVHGNLAKHFSMGSDYKIFEVGTPGGYYSPLDIQLHNSAQPGYITVSALGGPHPMVDSLDQCLQRHWRVSAPGMFFDSSEVALNYLPEDFTAAFQEALHESAMAAGRYDAGLGWSFPSVLGRIYNGPNDGGRIIVSGNTSFGQMAEFTTGRDQASIHTAVLQDTIPPSAPESLQIFGFNPSYWLNGSTASVPVGWINPYDSTGIARAFYKTYTPPVDSMDLTDSIMVVGGARDTFWLPVDTLNGTMPVYVWLRDGAGNVSHLNYSAVLARRDTVPPLGSTVKPLPSDTISATVFQVSWSPGADALSGIQAWRVLSRVDTSLSWDTLAAFHNDTSITFIGALPGHRYYFEAAACDSAGNWEAMTGTPEATIYVAALAVDTIPPYIISTVPINGETGVALNTMVSIQFSEPIRASLLSYSFQPAIGGLYVNWSADSTLLSIGHDPFAPQVTYLVSIASATDTMGLPLVGPSSFSFTTEAATDTVRPRIVSASPENGQTNVALEQPIVIVFSEPVDASSFRFHCLPQNVTGWRVSWNGANQVVTLTHDNFAYGTTYTFRVDSVADLAGIPMDTSASPNQPWSFTTVQLTTVSTPWTGGAWRLWSAPLLPQDTSALAVLGDDLGAYSDTTWRLVGYKQSNGYIERPSIWPGYGYWLASVQSAALDAQGSLLYGTQTVSLESGWNLVGNPFDIPVSLSDLRVRWYDGVSYELPYDDLSVDSLILRQTMWIYTDNSGDLVNNGTWESMSPYNLRDSLRPWQGYAVYALRPCTLLLERFTKGPRKSTPPAFSLDWQLELSAYRGPWADRGLVLGASAQAKEGYDRLDAEKPPLVAENLAIFIPHHDWNQGPGHRYLRDIRPPGPEQRWTVEVQSDRNEPVRIDYLLTGSLPAGNNLYLVNRRLGQAQMLGRQGHVELGGSGQLEVICSRRSLAELKINPLEFGLARISPNPFRGRTAISYQLDQPGRASLKVYNTAGQLVATLVEGHQEPGFHTALWDGSRQASGVYIVRLESSGRVRAIKTVKLR